ncbi:MAG: DUF1552 domain-containing protein [Nannocystis sp.]|nr:DUF1552 domain-containing protein [Nannocystis sp.]
MTRPHRFGRRLLLASAAATIALPFLEAFAPGRSARGAIPARPPRFIAVYLPNGVVASAFTPAALGPLLADPDEPDKKLPPTLAPLGELAARVSVISGLSNAPAEIDGAGHHATGTAAFLTATTARRSDSAPQLGISLDQRFAQEHAHQLAFPSLQLGVDGGGHVGDCDNGFACAYSRNISWAGPTTPLPKLTDPALVFDLLLAGDDPDATQIERARRRALRSSVLDHARGDAAALHAELGAADRHRLSDYLDALRQLERRAQAPAPRCDDAAAFDPSYTDLTEHVHRLNELIVLALRCDLTRAVTFMLGNSASARTYPFLGVADAHHDLSHNAGDPDMIRDLLRVEAWELSCFADLLRRLRDAEDGEHDLLSGAAVLLSSEISESNTHSHRGLPVLLAGEARGAFAPGNHLSFEPDTPYARLLLSILRALGGDDDHFGDDGDRPLEGL